ncbi:MAG: rhodanese-like domain-containing protein [bacterium]
MILIDVRTKEEYDAGHIDGAILFDIMDIMQGLYPNYPKDAEISLYCESGNRSMMAKIMLEKAGFTKITDAGSIDNLRE